MAEFVPFTYHATVNLAVTNSSANVAIPTSAPALGPNPADTVIVQNVGTKECFIAFGTLSTVTAVVPTTSNTVGFPIQPTLAVNYHFPLLNNGFIAAICGGSDTTTLRISVGHGRV